MVPEGLESSCGGRMEAQQQVSGMVEWVQEAES